MQNRFIVYLEIEIDSYGYVIYQNLWLLTILMVVFIPMKNRLELKILILSGFAYNAIDFYEPYLPIYIWSTMYLKIIGFFKLFNFMIIFKLKAL